MTVKLGMFFSFPSGYQTFQEYFLKNDGIVPVITEYSGSRTKSNIVDTEMLCINITIYYLNQSPFPTKVILVFIDAEKNKKNLSNSVSNVPERTVHVIKKLLYL